MKLFAESIASASKVTVAVPPMGPPFDAGPGTPGLRLVEAARQDERHLRHRRHGGRHALDAPQAARLRRGAKHARAGARRLRVGPVVELLTAPPPRREPAHVGPLCIGALQVLVREIAVLVPLLLLGDAEVDEGLVPDVGEAHGCAESYSGRRSPKTEEPTRT